LVRAHRRHPIMPADAILVVEGGEIVERGQHDDLLRRGGRYSSFFRLQHRETHPSLAPVSATASSYSRFLTPTHRARSGTPHPLSSLPRRKPPFPSSANQNPIP